MGSGAPHAAPRNLQAPCVQRPPTTTRHRQSLTLAGVLEWSTTRPSLSHFGLDLLNGLCAADADFHFVCLEAGDDTPAAGRDTWAEPLGVGLAVRKETCRLGRQRRPRERYKHERHQRREPELSKNHDYPPVFPRHPSDGRRPANKFAPSCSPPHLGNNPRPPTRLL